MRKLCLWTTLCGCETAWGSIRLEWGISLCTRVHVSFLPIGCVARIWIKWWLSKQTHSPSSQLPLLENLTGLTKGREATPHRVLWRKEEKSAEWKLGSLGGFWQRMQGSSRWKPGFRRGVARPIYLIPLTGFCGKLKSLCSDGGDMWW